MPSFRALGMMLSAAVALNFMNYIFSYYYDSPRRRDVTVFLGRKMYPEFNPIEHLSHVTERYSKKEGTEPNPGDTGTVLSSKPATEIIWCPVIPPNLGPIVTDAALRNPVKLEHMFSEVEPGGIYKPAGCKARHRVTVIIPYRGENQSSLSKFLSFIHQFLMKQQLQYEILVVEQGNTKPFNHGWLLNAGFTEAIRRSGSKNINKCFILHEPYLIPMNTRNLYRCGNKPRQLAVSVEKSDRSLYIPQFGGAVAIKADQYIEVNGFSNNYWGNDADLEDMYLRLKYSNMSVGRSVKFIGMYTTLKDYAIPYITKSQLQQTLPPMNNLDGLSTHSYIVNKHELKPLHTYLNVTEDNENRARISKTLIWNKVAEPKRKQQTHFQLNDTDYY